VGIKVWIYKGDIFENKPNVAPVARPAMRARAN